MPDTFARMRQLVGTTTEWATNDLVIGLGEIAIEKAGGEAKIKVGDGASRFSALPYASGAQATVAWGNITGKPTAFPPAAHTHPPADVTGLVDGTGRISLTLIPDTLKERLDWKGSHTPTLGAQYPASPVAGDTWGILGPAFTFTTGTLSGKTVSEGAAIVYDSGRWNMISGGGGASGDFVEVADLTTTSTGPTMAGKVPQLNTSGRLDPSLMNVPGSLQFRGTVDITQPPPVGVNSGDYWLVGIGGVAHAGWTGIAGQTLTVNDMVIWNGVLWTYTHTAGAASGFVPIDGSAPMTGALSLAAYGAGQPVAAHAIRKDYLDAQLGDIPTAEELLGFLPLNPSNNLSELTDDATARSNLGLTATATTPPSGFIQTSLFTAAKQIPIALAPNSAGVIAAPGGPKLLLSTSTSSEVAWQADWFLDLDQNLADVPDKAAARANLGVPDLSDIILKSTVDAPGDLIVGTADNTVARLGRGTAGQSLLSTAGGVAWGSAGIIREVTLASPAATIDLFSLGCKTVQLVFYLAVVNDNQFVLIRLATGTTVISTASYGILQTSTGGSPVTVSGAGTAPATAFDIANAVSNVAGHGVMGTIMVSNLATGGLFGATGQMHWHVSGGANAYYKMDKSFRHASGGDGFQLSAGTGNLAAGSFVRVIGWP